MIYVYFKVLLLADEVDRQMNFMSDLRSVMNSLNSWKMNERRLGNVDKVFIVDVYTYLGKYSWLFLGFICTDAFVINQRVSENIEIKNLSWQLNHEASVDIVLL